MLTRSGARATPGASATVEGMESSSVPGAGWFADPAGSGGQRWWSGASWTEHVRQVATAASVATPAPVATMVAERPSQTPSPAVPFTLAVPAAPTVVGFTSQVDPAIASRYRSKRAEESVEELALMGASGPAQPGWQGKPLPNDAGYLSVAGFGSGTAASAMPVAQGGYALPGRTNKTAWSALGSGALALGLAIFFLFFDRIGLWPTLLAVAAIVQGVLGLIQSRGTGIGRVPSVCGILLGLAAIGSMAGAIVMVLGL